MACTGAGLADTEKKSNEIEMKTCTKCGVEKNESEFHKSNDGKNGLRAQCKACRNSEVREWKLKNVEERKEYAEKWYREHKKAVSCRMKEYRLKNLDKEYLNRLKNRLKKTIGEAPPPEFVEARLIISKTKRLCKTLKS